MAVSAIPMEYVRVVKSATCGRSLVFTSKFAPGQCILEELPCAYTLLDNKRGLYCDFCLKQCSTLKKCSRCNYVSYCNKSCQIGDWARCHKQECKTLKKIHPRPPDLHVAQLLSQLIRKQSKSAPCTQEDEDCFPTTVDQLESNHEKLSDTKRNHFESLLCVLKQFLEEDVLAEPSSWLKMYGATLCNGFSIMDYGLYGLIDIANGVYLRASMVNHSCDPNCALVFDGRKLQVRTVKDVKEGEECTISYFTAVNYPTKERQAFLDHVHYFTCKCVKCIEEINALEPDAGLTEEILGLEKSKEEIEMQIQFALITKDWTKVLQKFETYLRSCLPAHHYLLVEVRDLAFGICCTIESWGKAAQMGQLITKPNRDHYGPYHPSLGIHLLRMGQALLNLKRFQEARKYLTEAKSVLEVTHGPQHSLMKSTSVQKLLCRFR
eukprot:XP_011670031.1 PREDICTED: histone-lysine N-methyltransferase SMYD3-like isoform X2 [Strongylocentrotus purpuratus]